MQDRNQIEALLRAFYDARVKGDIGPIQSSFAPNATFEVAGSTEASPLPTTVHGHDGIVALMQGMISAFSLTDFEIVEMLVDGSKAAVRWSATVHHGSDVFTTELADFVDVSNGQIVSFVEYLDTALAAQVLGRR